MSKIRLAISRKEHFNAAHRLNNPALSAEENRELFGKCNNDNFHGHNYELIVKVTGFVSPETGYVMDMKRLSEIIREEIVERFDHKNLNLDVPEFSVVNPTAENIAVVIFNILYPRLDKNCELKITLYETERNYVEYPA